MLQEFEREMRKQLVRYAVTRAITCRCGQILDCRSAVLYEAYDRKGESAGIHVLCDRCARIAHAKVDAALLDRGGFSAAEWSYGKTGELERIEVTPAEVEKAEQANRWRTAQPHTGGPSIEGTQLPLLEED